MFLLLAVKDLIICTLVDGIIFVPFIGQERDWPCWPLLLLSMVRSTINLIRTWKGTFYLLAFSYCYFYSFGFVYIGLFEKIYTVQMIWYEVELHFCLLQRHAIFVSDLQIRDISKERGTRAQREERSRKTGTYDIYVGMLAVRSKW